MTGEPTPTASTDGTKPEIHHGRPWTRIGLGLYLLLVVGWTAIFLATPGVRAGPRDTGLAGDFATFYTASRMLAQGENPYDPAKLYGAERSMWRQQGLKKPKYQPYIRAGNPPLLYWAVGPVAGLRYRLAGWIWVALMEGVLIAGFLTLLRAFGWYHRALPLVAFLGMPQTLLAAYYGNIDAVVFAGLALSLLLRRMHPAWSGAALAVAWLKPQYGLPLAVLVLAFNSHDWRRGTGGLVAVSVVAAVLTALTTGPASLWGWVGSLTGLSSHASVQPDVASLSGLYVYSAPLAVQRMLMALTLVIAAALTVWWRFRHRGHPSGFLYAAWLWPVWLLATPLAHFHYQIVLAAPVLALLGRDGEDLGRRSRLGVLYLLILSVLLFPTKRGRVDVQSLALIPVVVVLFVAARHQAAEPRKGGDSRAAGGGFPVGAVSE